MLSVFNSETKDFDLFFKTISTIENLMLIKNALFFIRLFWLREISLNQERGRLLHYKRPSYIAKFIIHNNIQVACHLARPLLLS